MYNHFIRSIAVFCFYACLIGPSVGQQVEFEWGTSKNEYNFPIKHSTKDINGNYLLKSGKKELWAFTHDLELINALELDVENKVKEQFGFHNTSSSTEYVLLTKKPKGKLALNAYSFSATDGLNPKATTLHEYEIENGKKFQKLYSIDSNLVAYVVATDEYKKREIEIVVFNRNLEKLWTKQFVIDLAGDQVFQAQYFGRKNELFVLVKDNRKDKSDKGPKQNFIVHKLTENETVNKKVQVKFNNDYWFLSNIMFYELPTGPAITTIVEGPDYNMDVIATHITGDLELISRVSTSMLREDIRTVNQQCDESCKNKIANMLDDMRFDGVTHDRQTGEVLITGAFHKLLNEGKNKTISKYVFIKLDATGALQWFNVLPTKQFIMMQNIDVISTFQTQIDDRLLFIFNDQIENWDKENIKKFENCAYKDFRKAGLIALFMDFNTGETEHQILLEHKTSGLVPSIKSIQKFANGDYRLIRRWGNFGVSYQVGRMHFTLD